MAEQKKDMRLICPYCGEEVTKDNVLFADGNFTSNKFEDTVRHDFLQQCCNSWPFKNGNKFSELYFKPTSENIRRTYKAGENKEDFPQILHVKGSEALTPSQLKGKSIAQEKEALRQAEIDDEERDIALRVCPRCHCQLPMNFGLYPNINITMLGGRAAGKTAFLISMIHQLSSQLSMHNLGTVQLEAESKIYYDLQNETYKQEGGLTEATSLDERLFPFVFQYTKEGGEGSCFINFYDLAGEGVETAHTNYMLNHLGIQQADAVMLMIDPNQLNNGMYYSSFQRRQENHDPNTGSGEGEAEQHDYYSSPISEFLTKAVTNKRTLGLLQNVRHVIAVMTKIDQPLMSEPKSFAGNCILKEDLGKAHMGALDTPVVAEVGKDVETFYARVKGVNTKSLKELIRSHFGSEASVDILAVSTWTRDHGMDGSEVKFQNSFDESASKHRIIEPFLVLLARYQMIPIRNGNPGPAPAKQPKPAKKHWWQRG